MIKNLSIFKRKATDKDTEKTPSHGITIKVGEEFVDAGACWTKSTKNGDKYLSCKLSDAYADYTKNISRKGYILVDEAEYQKLINELKISRGELLDEEVKEEERLSDGSLPPVF